MPTFDPNQKPSERISELSHGPAYSLSATITYLDEAWAHHAKTKTPDATLEELRILRESDARTIQSLIDANTVLLREREDLQRKINHAYHLLTVRNAELRGALRDYMQVRGALSERSDSLRSHALTNTSSIAQAQARIAELEAERFTLEPAIPPAPTESKELFHLKASEHNLRLELKRTLDLYVKAHTLVFSAQTTLANYFDNPDVLKITQNHLGAFLSSSMTSTAALVRSAELTLLLAGKQEIVAFMDVPPVAPAAVPSATPDHLNEKIAQQRKVIHQLTTELIEEFERHRRALEGPVKHAFPGARRLAGSYDQRIAELRKNLT